MNHLECFVLVFHVGCMNRTLKDVPMVYYTQQLSVGCLFS